MLCPFCGPQIVSVRQWVPRERSSEGHQVEQGLGCRTPAGWFRSLFINTKSMWKGDLSAVSIYPGGCQKPDPGFSHSCTETGWKVQILDIIKNLCSTKVFKHMQDFLEFSVEISKTMSDTSQSSPISPGLGGSDHLQRFFLLNYHTTLWNTLELLSQCQNWIHKSRSGW